MNLDALQAAHLPALNFAGDEDLKKQFQLNGTFYHQQASVFMRAEHGSEEWLKIIQRMAGQGARWAEEHRRTLADLPSRSMPT